MKNILCVFLLIMFQGVFFAQNNTYKIIYDSIYPIVNNDYGKAKIRWIKYCSGQNVDPAERILFLGHSLKNGDDKYYKKEIIDLIRLYGWHYSYADTLIQNTEKSMLLHYINERNLVNWTVKKSDKYFMEWQKKSSYNVIINDVVNSLIYMDQEITKIEFDILDSTEQNSVNRFLSIIDYNNIKRIEELCRMNGGIIPNHFDNGVGTYYKISLIIWHNLKNKDNFQKTWDLLFPFIEKAYFAGKISYTLFLAYDKWSYYHFGYQYYGALGTDIPVRNADSLVDRKKKYGL